MMAKMWSATGYYLYTISRSSGSITLNTSCRVAMDGESMSFSFEGGLSTGGCWITFTWSNKAFLLLWSKTIYVVWYEQQHLRSLQTLKLHTKISKGQMFPPTFPPKNLPFLYEKWLCSSSCQVLCGLQGQVKPWIHWYRPVYKRQKYLIFKRK